MNNPRNLTAKQQLFIAEYCACLNATEAARRAGYQGDDATLANVGRNNIRKTEIRRAIDKHLEGRIMAASEVLTRLTDIAEGDASDFLDIGKTFTMLDLNKAKTKGKLHLIKKLSTNKYGHVEVELYDGQAALNTLAKYHKLLTDRVIVDWRAEAEEKGVDVAKVQEDLVDEFTKYLK